METPFFAFGMAKERITTAMVTRTMDNGDGITYTDMAFTDMQMEKCE